MIFEIKSPLNTSTKKIRENFISRANRYILLLEFENNSEYKKWNEYLKNYYKTAVKDCLLEVINNSKVVKSEDGYKLYVFNKILNNGLTLDSFCKLMNSGNLDIRKTYILRNIISYSLNNI